MGKKHKTADFMNMGTAVGLCAAIGVALGALLNNVTLWLCVGAGVGVVLGAVVQMYKSRRQ
ncbi:MAG TPA: hypothetical protein VN369_04070 [Terriglobales bacterium]|nr:hypothetical protein [Terriglobales bacterium]